MPVRDELHPCSFIFLCHGYPKLPKSLIHGRKQGQIPEFWIKSEEILDPGRLLIPGFPEIPGRDIHGSQDSGKPGKLGKVRELNLALENLEKSGNFLNFTKSQGIFSFSPEQKINM